MSFLRKIQIQLCALAIIIPSVGFTDVGLSYLKNNVSVSTTSGIIYGTYPFYSKLALEVYNLNSQGQYELLKDASEFKQIEKGLLPGMVLHIPIRDSKLLSTMIEKDDKTLKEFYTEIAENDDFYIWSAWDKGDRENKGFEIKWYLLTLSEGVLQNNGTCNQIYSQTIDFSSADSNDAKWQVLENALFETENPLDILFKNNETVNSNLVDAVKLEQSPWQRCLTHEEVPDSWLIQLPGNTHKSLKIPEDVIIKSSQRFGYSIVPKSRYGYPKKGFPMMVWDISKVWGQQVPYRSDYDMSTVNSTEYTNIDIIKLDKIIPNVLADNLTNNFNLGFPYLRHKYIKNSRIQSLGSKAYRVRIFDKEYYDSEPDKNNLLSCFDLSAHNKTYFNNPSQCSEESIYKKFYVNREYVGIIEIVDQNEDIRYLTINEAYPDAQTKLDFPEAKNIRLELFFEDENGLTYEYPDKTTKKGFIIVYEYQGKLVGNPDSNQELPQSPDERVKLKLFENSNQIEYVLFKTQLNNDEAEFVDGCNKSSKQKEECNPEAGEQKFSATIHFDINRDVQAETISSRKTNDMTGFQFFE